MQVGTCFRPVECIFLSLAYKLSMERKGQPGVWLHSALATAVCVRGAHAHHGTAGRYESELLEITGTVAGLMFINPHALLAVEVPDEQGNPVRWMAEFNNPPLMAEQGWHKIDVESDGGVQRWKVEMGGTSSLLSSGRLSHDSLKPGDRVEVVGHPSRHTEFELKASRMILPDGREITMRNPYGPVPFLERLE